MSPPSPGLGRPQMEGARRTTALLFTLAVLSYTDRQILSILVEPIRADLGFTDFQIGILQGAAFAVVYAFAGLPFGMLADRVSRRLVIASGLVFWSASSAACGLATDFESFLLARMGVGIGEAALAPAAASLICDMWRDDRRNRALGVFYAGMIVGGGAAVMAGGALLELFARPEARGLFGDLAPWRLVLIATALPAFPLLLLVLWIAEPARSATMGLSSRRGFQAVRRLFENRWRSLVPLYLAGGVITIADTAGGAWAPSVFVRTFDRSLTVVGAQLGAIAIVSGLLAMLASGWIFDRAARTGGDAGRIAGVVACGAAAVSAWFGILPEALALVGYTVFVFGASLAASAAIMAIQQVLSDDVRGLGSALISFFNILAGVTLGSSIPTLIAPALGQGGAGLAIAIGVTGTIAATSALMLLRPRRSEAPRCMDATGDGWV